MSLYTVQRLISLARTKPTRLPHCLIRHALRYSFGLIEEANVLDKAISNVLAQGFRTGDIMQPNMHQVGTIEMGDAILKELGAVTA